MQSCGGSGGWMRREANGGGGGGGGDMFEVRELTTGWLANAWTACH